MAILHLENFAKIKNSDFDIQDITVFAGKPGTGKSYIMKMLFAMNDAITYNHPDNDKSFSNLNKLENNSDDMIDKIFEELPNLYKNSLTSIFGELNQIGDNFKINIGDVNLEYKNNKLITKYNKKSEDNILSNNNIFVETPLILEFYKFMDKTPFKTPHHIESLMNILKEDYSPTDEEQDKFIENFVIKTQSIINGNIKNEGQGFSFTNNDNKRFDIVNASSGIKSIGLLQYLVTNKALKKGSVLFWEEPEVHLHPSWQLKMVDLFIELMDAGVKIVFSTHSPFMADYLNAKAKRENFSKRISFNVLEENDGIVKNTILNEENFTLLQSELMDSFEDILWQYL